MGTLERGACITICLRPSPSIGTTGRHRGAKIIVDWRLSVEVCSKRGQNRSFHRHGDSFAAVGSWKGPCWDLSGRSENQRATSTDPETVEKEKLPHNSGSRLLG